MKVRVYNRTEQNQFISTDGDDTNLDAIILLGPRDAKEITITTEKQLTKLQKQFAAKVDLRKV